MSNLTFNIQYESKFSQIHILNVIKQDAEVALE